MWIAGNIPNRVDVEWLKARRRHRRPRASAGRPLQRRPEDDLLDRRARRRRSRGHRLSADVPVLRHRHRRHAARPDRPRRRRGAVRRRHARPHLYRHHRHGGRVRGAWGRRGRRQLGQGAPQPLARGASWPKAAPARRRRKAGCRRPNSGAIADRGLQAPGIRRALFSSRCLRARPRYPAPIEITRIFPVGFVRPKCHLAFACVPTAKEGWSAWTAIQSPHAHHRPRRLERLRQDHAAHQGDSRASSARGLPVSTVKHAHHGFDVDQPGKDSHTHRTAGATEVLVGSAQPLGAGARAARRAGAGPRRAARRSCRRSISCWSKASSASAHPEARGAPRRERQAAAASGRSARSSRSRPTRRCRRRACRWSISTTSTASSTFCCGTRCRSTRLLARVRSTADGAAHRRLLRVLRPAAAGRRGGAHDRRARRAGRRDRDACRSPPRAAACSPPT